jgi:hypothetical protein
MGVVSKMLKAAVYNDQGSANSRNKNIFSSKKRVVKYYVFMDSNRVMIPIELQVLL